MKHHVTQRFVLVGFAVLTAFAMTTSAGAVSPINPNNRPTPIPGATNGVLAPQALINVGPNCVASRAAGPSLARIFALAHDVGVSLGAEECYRRLSDEILYANQSNQPGNNPACVAQPSRNSSGQIVGTSYHGWGKAADLTDAGRSLTFTTPGYGFMKRVAGSLGWNHPAFAEPGGSSCPEPWHWEWVGDGGSLHASPVRGDVVGLVRSNDNGGYATVTGLGALATHGNFVSHGDAGAWTLAWVVVGAASTPSHAGYWLVGADGGIFGFGNAPFKGSAGAWRLAAPVVGMTSSHSGNGYWLVASDGGVFAFGDAPFRGSMGAYRLVAPMVGIAPTHSGAGYWTVAADGGIFGFGDAHFYGSMGGYILNQPVVGMAPTPTGNGYWLVAADGGVFGFGDAHYHGSLGAATIVSPAVSLEPTSTGNGYWITLADGEVFNFGDAS